MTITDAAFDLAALRADYHLHASKAERLRICIVDQVSALLESARISLGVPMESRVKSLGSIEEKISRKTYSPSGITQVTDLVGVRLILLFLDDLSRLSDIIRDNFDILSQEDAGSRLGESQFGYQSQHYIVRLKSEWLKIPSYSDLGDISVEIQARTIAQHIWAAASHKLQYKHEDSVPVPLRRTINRISALLETVDLEFERILHERDEYLDQQSGVTDSGRDLNVNLIDLIATKILPPDNRDPEDDDLDEVLRDLNSLGIKTSDQLESLLAKHLDKIREIDRKHLPDFDDPSDENPERTAKGVYFTFAGLIRQALEEEFGAEELREAMRARKAATEFPPL
jgi:putative GTP pyrophosphokinase